MDTKCCRKCKTEKSTLEFSKNIRSKDGLYQYCKPCESIRQREYRTNSKHIVVSNKKKYYEKNKDRIIKKQVSRELDRRRVNPQVRLVYNLRRRMQSAVKAAKVLKSSGTYKLLGCSPEELKKFIESKFTEGMTWENQGAWHIDHIKPCASFDLADPEQQRQCFHYTNLQPLWAVDNLRKGAKL